MRAAHRIALAAGCVLGALACSDATDPGTATDAQVTTDLVMLTGEDVATDVGLMWAGLPMAGASASTASAGGADAANCSWDATAQRHVCSTVTDGGLSITRSFAFYDADGAPMQRYDSLLTASMNLQVEIDGTRSGDRGTRRIHREADKTVSGLAGAETQRTWNGTAASADTGTFEGELNTRTYAGTTEVTTSNVVFELPRAEHPYPASGSITSVHEATLTVTGARDETRTISRTVTVTFNGTAAVPIVSNGVTCTLHLDTRTVSGCSR